MKICFFLQRRFAYIGHAMAFHMKQEWPETEFCAVTQVRQSHDFLSSQKDIAYTSLVLDEDIFKKIRAEKVDTSYIAWLEQEYGIPNLWPYLYIDRVVMNGQLVREYPYNNPSLSHEEMLACVQVYAKEIIAFLDRERPDAVVISVIGCVSSLLLYHIAKKRGIKSINIEFARIGNRIVYSEDYSTLSWVKERFQEIQQGRVSLAQEQAKTFLEKFREEPAPYDADYMQEFYAKKGRLSNLSFLYPKRLLHSIPWHFRTLFTDIRRARRQDYTDIFLWNALWDKLKRKVRGVIGFSGIFSTPNYSVPYAYFPLHIEPEIAMMLYAPYYTNQIELIKVAARALPMSMKLYVKEHPGMAGYRTRAFYKELKKIPNVCIVAPHLSGTEVARHAALTITITSTSGWEALLLKKPVITFGDVFFNDIPGVLRCRGFEELPYLVKQQLELWKHDEKTLVNYISALIEDSVEVDFSELWNRGASANEMKDDAGVRHLALLLGNRVGLRTS